MAVVFIKGDDEALVAQAVATAVDDLLGDGDRSLTVEELGEEHFAGGEQLTISPLVTSAQTMPFLTERRIVVGRNLALFSKAAMVLPLVEMLAAAPETTDLVLVWERASTTSRMPAVPKPLNEALKSAGAEVVDAAPTGRRLQTMLDDRLEAAPVQLDRSARGLIADRLGDQVGRLSSLLDTLASTFGPEIALTAADVSPFLGEASGVPPWELTDAIDAGQINVALEKLQRMTVGGAMHPLQTMAILQGHYTKALRLDGSGARDDSTAAAILDLGNKKFPAKKALNLSKRLGQARLRQAVTLLAKADLDLRGGSGLPPGTIMTVLVARLTRLSTAR